MITKEEMKQSEMSYPLKMNRLIRGAFISPCPDCKTPHGSDAKDCDEWCLKNCAHNIDREILSERQKKIHDERRSDSLSEAIKALSSIRDSCNVSDSEYRKRVLEITDRIID